MREPKPFFRKQTQCWYVQIGKKQIRLGTDEEDAREEYHKIMTRRRENTVHATDSVQTLLNRYLDWCKVNRADSTFDRRLPIIKSFGLSVGPGLKIPKLRPYHIQRWIDEKYSDPHRHSDTYRNTLITAVKGAIEWAAEQGYIEHSPIARMKKPRAAIRQLFIPSAKWSEIYKAARDEYLRDFLVVMLASGARPQEMFKIEARHFDPGGSRLVFGIPESKGEAASRVIYLPSEALEIVDRLAQRHPQGKLFRNSKGDPWNRNSIKCRFRRLRRVLKEPELTATTLRHSFAHYRLVNGQDSHAVSKLMGHVDGRMLATRYGHLEQNTEAMLGQANYLPSPVRPEPPQPSLDAKSDLEQSA